MRSRQTIRRSDSSANEEYERQTGFDTESLTGQTPVEAAGPESVVESPTTTRRVSRPVNHHFEELDLHPTGVWETQVTPIAADGEITGFVDISRESPTERSTARNWSDRTTSSKSLRASFTRHPRPAQPSPEVAHTCQRTGNDEQFDRSNRAINRMKELIEDLLDSRT
ncbi:hypothetical protein C8039_17505 [Halogeometricum sp. wsp3]|nr:hypothetical protein C8039_17505 [Halogeometricum sp. wsp3]